MVVKNTAVKHKMYTTAIKWTRDAFKGDSVFRKKNQKKTKIYMYVSKYYQKHICLNLATGWTLRVKGG